jgi:DNA-binding response OmpR family regulator
VDAVDAGTKLLIVDDEADLLAELKALLERTGYKVAVAHDGRQALAALQRSQFDLIVLDVLMPHLNGREVLRSLRQRNDWTPVILLTRVGTPTERALSLQEGADDYLNKPFEPLELIARIQAILRRSRRGAVSLTNVRTLIAERIRLDRQMRRLFMDDQEVSLTTRAFGVLEYLMLHPHEIVDRVRLLDEIWGWANAVGTRAVDIRIVEIRKALGDDSESPQYIETVVGQGYRWIISVEGRP